MTNYYHLQDGTRVPADAIFDESPDTPPVYDNCPFKQSNYLMLREFVPGFSPKNHGILLQNEIEEIETALHIKDRNLMSLQNLRDFVVMYFDILEEKSDDRRKTMDIMSGIVSVIDGAKISLGGDV